MRDLSLLFICFAYTRSFLLLKNLLQVTENEERDLGCRHAFFKLSLLGLTHSINSRVYAPLWLAYPKICIDGQLVLQRG